MSFKVDYEDARALGTAALYALRQRVASMRRDGATRAAISAATGLSPSAVSKVLRLYALGGMAALELKARGRPHGSCRLLAPQQELALVDMVGGPAAAGRLWTRAGLAVAVTAQLGAALGLRTLTHYLHRWQMPAAGSLRRQYRSHPAVRQAVQAARQRQAAELVWVDVAQWQPPSMLGHTVLMATGGRGTVCWSSWPGRPGLAQWQAWCDAMLARASAPLILVFRDDEEWPPQLAPWLAACAPALRILRVDQLLRPVPELPRTPW